MNGARPSSKALRKAIAHQEAGRIQDAKRLYLSVLQDDPRNPDANRALGLLSVKQGKVEAALPFLTAALQSDPRQPAHWCAFIEALLTLGRIGDARAVFQKGLSNGLAGAAALALKTRIDHSEMLRRAIEHHNAGQLSEAEQLCARILSEDSAHADGLHMAGLLACHTGRTAAGVELIGRAIRAQGNVAAFHRSLGSGLAALGQIDDAIRSFERSIELNPHDPDTHSNLAIVLHGAGQVDAALDQSRKTLQLDPAHLAAHNSIGAILLERGKHAEAISHFEAALRAGPQQPDLHNNLASALRGAGQLDRAVDRYREALRLKPDHVDALSNLAGALKEQGKLAEAADTYKAAIHIKPGFLPAHSNLLMLLGYSADVPHHELVAQAKEFDRCVTAPLLRMRPSSNIPDPMRRLRIGYVSGDFREHAVGYFLEPLLAHHDHEHFEIFAYATMHLEDHVTARMKASVDHWRSIRSLNDDDAANLIEQDGVDILIDLSGHMAGNRLLVFARKPAPVQATWLGFTTTTGMSAIDYRITDGHADPVGMTEHYNV
jgi:protein O-GlcNAc transferase